MIVTRAIVATRWENSVTLNINTWKFKAHFESSRGKSEVQLIAKC
jgi:hypothetical protein